jgi:hypothetical protein
MNFKRRLLGYNDGGAPAFIQFCVSRVLHYVYPRSFAQVDVFWPAVLLRHMATLVLQCSTINPCARYQGRKFNALASVRLIGAKARSRLAPAADITEHALAEELSVGFATSPWIKGQFD